MLTLGVPVLRPAPLLLPLRVLLVLSAYYHQACTGFVFVEPPAPGHPQSVTLRSETQSVTFARLQTTDEFLLNGTRVRSGSGGWLSVFDVPTAIVAGSTAWNLRPTAVTVTQNDSAAACVNFTRRTSTSGSTPGSFWIGVCVDSASNGLVSFSANLLVANGTVIGPNPEPQLVLRRHATASQALDQGPLSIYHNPVVATQGESSKACGAGVGAGALGHGLGFPAAHARWDASTAVEAELAEGVEAAIYFNMTASQWFSRAGHGRFGSAWIRSTNGSLGFVTECLYGSTIPPGPAKIQWYLKQGVVSRSSLPAVASKKLQGLDWTMRAFAPLHPMIPARETLTVATRATPYASSWKAYVNQTTRQLLVPNVTVAEGYPNFQFTDWPIQLAPPFDGMLAHFSRPAYDSHGDAAAHDWSCVNNHLAPWLLWRRLQPEEVDSFMSETLDRKIRQLPAFYDNVSNLVRYDVSFGRAKDHVEVENWTTRSHMPEGLSMTWQNFFFHSETLRIADVQPTAAFLPQTHGRVIMATQALIECAHTQQYAFGQFFDPVGRHAVQQHDQPALGVVREPWQVGTYALTLLRAHELTGNTTLLAEAEASFEALFNGSMSYTLQRDINSSGPIGPEDQFVNETISDTADFPITEIEGNGYGVIAAIQLAKLTGDDTKYATYMRHFVNSLLRDTPWGSDRTDDTARSFDSAGLFAPYVGGLPSLPWESNIAQAGIAAALSASASVGMPPETRRLLLKISNLHRLNGFSWYPAGYTVQQRALYKLPELNHTGGYLEYIPIETMYGFENGAGSAGQASYMACHAMWMWWLHEALAVAVDTDTMVMNTIVWGRALERAVRGLYREFAVFHTGNVSGNQTVTVQMLALREGAVYNVSTLTGSSEYTATRLAAGIGVPVDRGGEGTLTVELLREKTGGAEAVAAEMAALHAAEAAQGALATAYAALQSAPLTSAGKPRPKVQALVPTYDSARAQYASKSYVEAAKAARGVVEALRE